MDLCVDCDAPAIRARRCDDCAVEVEETPYWRPVVPIEPPVIEAIPPAPPVVVVSLVCCVVCGRWCTSRWHGRLRKYCSSRCAAQAPNNLARSAQREAKQAELDKLATLARNANQTCARCQKVFSAQWKRMYCSDSCSAKAARRRATERGGCQHPGCDAGVLARGLCGTHYNRQYQHQRHRKILVDCAWCGRPTEKEAARSHAYGQRFCSTECQGTMYAHRAGSLVCEVPRWHRAHPECRAGKDLEVWQAPIPRVRPRPARIAWVAGQCRNCDKLFVDRWLAERSSQTCSPKCSKRIAKDRRRAVERSAFVAPVNRGEIYARDGWICRLCHKPVARDKAVPHPLAPTLDHIIPLAVGVDAGGVHAPHNVQCAHFICNSLKSDTILTTQLALFG